MSLRKLGIDHVSPSSINMWHANRAMFVLKYFYGYRETGNDRMTRGKAVEIGVENWLTTRDQMAALQAALLHYDRNAADSKERLLIEPMLDGAIRALEGGGIERDGATQTRIERQLDWCDVPLVGFVDFPTRRNNAPVVIELKTTARMPSVARRDHMRQLAYYTDGEVPGAILYVADKKRWLYEPEMTELRAARDELHGILRSMISTLSRCQTRDDVAAGVWPDYDDFRWDNQSIEFAKEIWK